MKNYMVTVEISGLFDVPVKADNLEHALDLAKKIQPQDAIKVRTKKIGIMHWETGEVTSIYEG